MVTGVGMYVRPVYGYLPRVCSYVVDNIRITVVPGGHRLQLNRLVGAFDVPRLYVRCSRSRSLIVVDYVNTFTTHTVRYVTFRLL